MKSDIFENRYYIECSCGCDSILCFEIMTYKTKGENLNTEIGAYFSPNYHLPWYKRIIQAIKYIFKPSPFSYCDSVIITEQNIGALYDVMAKIGKAKFKIDNDIKEQLIVELSEIFDYGSDNFDLEGGAQLITINRLINKIKELKNV